MTEERSHTDSIRICGNPVRPSGIADSLRDDLTSRGEGQPRFTRWAALFLVLGGIIGWLLSPRLAPPMRGVAGTDEDKRVFTCGMHPQAVQSKPGHCSVCGMKLTPARPGAEGVVSVSTIRIDPRTTQNMGVRTGVVTNGPLRRVIRTVGAVDFDESRLWDVTAKYKGWIEKLRVNTTGQAVTQGEVLFEVYSPDLFAAQTEYLLVLGSSRVSGVTGDALLESERTKLAYLDLTEDQIAALEKDRQARRILEKRARRDGVVIEKMVVEGQMVEAGMKLYRMADLSTVWVLCQVYEQDLAAVVVGQEASAALSYGPIQEYPGKVAFIYPTIDEKTRAARVRLELPNPARELKPGMFATVTLRAELSPSALLVPDMAVVRSGQSNTVFVVLSGGRFEARAVKLGFRAENSQYQVIEGLKEGERVVISGQFMLDSESQLSEALQKAAPLR